MTPHSNKEDKQMDYESDVIDFEVDTLDYDLEQQLGLDSESF